MTPIALIPALIQAMTGMAPGAADGLFAAFRAASEQAAPIAVTALWQSAVITFGVAICLRLAPRTSAKDRFSIWTAAFAILSGLPLLALASGSGVRLVGGVSAAVPEGAARPWLSLDARWSLAIMALWALGTLLRAGDLAVHSFRLRKLWKDAIPVDVEGRLTAALSSIENRRVVQVCTTTELQRPSVIGFLKPRILIPDWLFARLTSGELEQIVLHEAEHLRRRDDWTNLVQKLCLVLFPLNPALAWMERRLCREREMACDDGVIRITRAPRAYAACLASLAERGLERRAEALSLGAWQRRPELVHRVHSILRAKRTLGPVGTRVVLGGLGCGLLFGAIALTRCPQLVAFVPARDLDRNGYAELSKQRTVEDDLSGQPPLRGKLISIAQHSQGCVRCGGLALGYSRRLPSGANEERVATRFSYNGEGRRAIGHWGEQAGGLAARKTASDKPDLDSPHTVLLKADMSDTRPAQPEEQQWIVLTTWEQVRMPSNDGAMAADYESGANSDAPGDASTAGRTIEQSNPQSAGQVTITRLILRVIPASSFSMQPAKIPLPGGWFVIQL